MAGKMGGGCQRRRQSVEREVGGGGWGSEGSESGEAED
jgi:hypothetical protein